MLNTFDTLIKLFINILFYLFRVSYFFLNPKLFFLKVWWYTPLNQTKCFYIEQFAFILLYVPTGIITEGVEMSDKVNRGISSIESWQPLLEEVQYL